MAPRFRSQRVSRALHVGHRREGFGRERAAGRCLRLRRGRGSSARRVFELRKRLRQLRRQLPGQVCRRLRRQLRGQLLRRLSRLRLLPVLRLRLLPLPPFLRRSGRLLPSIPWTGPSVRRTSRIRQRSRVQGTSWRRCRSWRVSRFLARARFRWTSRKVHRRWPSTTRPSNVRARRLQRSPGGTPRKRHRSSWIRTSRFRARQSSRFFRRAAQRRRFEPRHARSRGSLRRTRKALAGC
jgi:hypothetical protein